MRATLEASGRATDIRETGLARTAAQAAEAVDCNVDQIAKSIVFQGSESGSALLFITAGGREVDLERAANLAGEPLIKATADLVRAQTGFAIGGVSPIGHVGETPKWFDTTLLQFDFVWAAAGTPHHVFRLPPADLLALSGALAADFTKPRE